MMRFTRSAVVAVTCLSLAACGSSSSTKPAATSTSPAALSAQDYAKQMRCANSGQGVDQTGVLGSAGADDFTSCSWGNQASGEVVLARFDSDAAAAKADAKVPAAFSHYAYRNFVVVGNKVAIGVAKFCQDPKTPDSSCS